MRHGLRIIRRVMRILLVKTSSLGDVIHNLPVATDLARHFPGVAIDWVVEESFAAIPRLHPAVRRVIPVAVRRWRRTLLQPATWREMAAFRRAVSADFYDVVLDTQGLLKSALIAGSARGDKRGYAADSAREALATRFYDQTFSVPKDLHAVERNRLLAAAAFDYPIEFPLDYGIAAPPLVAPWLPVGDYAVLLTATSRTDKEWPEEDWLALGQALIVMGMRCVLPAGSPLERARAARLAEKLGRAIAAPPLPLTELAGLMAGAQIVVGVDTGLTHLAAALEKPTVALFCGSDPHLTGVFAGERALNLGGMGQPPDAGAVLKACTTLLSA